MHFTALLCAIAAPVALAKVAFTNTDYNLQDGKPYTLNWQGAEGPVKLSLMRGSSDNLQKVKQIASGITESSYTWTPDSTIQSDTYSFTINDGSSTNYSPQFDYSS